MSCEYIFHSFDQEFSSLFQSIGTNNIESKAVITVLSQGDYTYKLTETFQFKNIAYNNNKYLVILGMNIGTYLLSIVKPSILAASPCRRKFRNDRKAIFIPTHFNLLFRTLWCQTTNL